MYYDFLKIVHIPCTWRYQIINLNVSKKELANNFMGLKSCYSKIILPV